MLYSLIPFHTLWVFAGFLCHIGSRKCIFQASKPCSHGTSLPGDLAWFIKEPPTLVLCSAFALGKSFYSNLPTLSPRWEVKTLSNIRLHQNALYPIHHPINISSPFTQTLRPLKHLHSGFSPWKHMYIVQVFVYIVNFAYVFLWYFTFVLFWCEKINGFRDLIDPQILKNTHLN